MEVLRLWSSWDLSRRQSARIEASVPLNFYKLELWVRIFLSFSLLFKNVIWVFFSGVKMLKSTSLKKSAKKKEGGGDEEAPPAPKRSRRHRRRPSNLRQEYQRRQGKHVWLETHLWHAKRFKMAELWGHKIPIHPSDKSARATYRYALK